MTNNPPLLKEWARAWLFDNALPLWSSRGFDSAHGGFFDQLDVAGNPTAIAKRCRVQSRQAFVYATAGLMGWPGPWQEAMLGGLDFLSRAFLRPDGLYRASVEADGTAANDNADLYDQAFVLFALAAAARAQPDNPAHLERAAKLLVILDGLFVHPLGGFLETDDRVGLRSNPQMHLLEALLEWIEFTPSSKMGRLCAKHAHRIVALALERLIDARTGAIGEYFDDQWRFANGPEGGLREPGHQFEWAYLLDRANRLLGIDSAIAMARLYEFGIAHGLSEGRVIFSVDADGRAVDKSSRLWAQTELLRTAISFSRAASGTAAAPLCAQARASGEWVRHFLDVPLTGCWRDRITSQGAFIKDEPAPASSFYHIMTGFTALFDLQACVDG